MNNNNNKFYVKDAGMIKYFENVPQVVKFLEEVVKFKFGQTRKEFTQHLIDLGHGVDSDQLFVESMAENAVEIGVAKNDRLVRCNICEIGKYNKNSEYGD